jgi:hypothetical protein
LVAIGGATDQTRRKKQGESRLTHFSYLQTRLVAPVVKSSGPGGTVREFIVDMTRNVDDRSI